MKLRTVIRRAFKRPAARRNPAPASTAARVVSAATPESTAARGMSAPTRKSPAVLLATAAMSAALLAGCTAGSLGTSKHQTATAEQKYDEFLTVDVYSETANYQGIQTGWFAKIVKDKFNMELNIIATNVAGSGDLLFQTRTAAGSLGDLIIINTSNGKLEQLIDSGLAIDLSGYLSGSDIFTRYPAAIETMRSVTGTDAIYGLPTYLSEQAADAIAKSSEADYGPYLRWDYYEALGCPEMATMEDLLDVMEAMQKLARDDTGRDDIYAFSFFRDWDGAMMNNAKQPCCMYGYDEIGFVLSKGDGSAAVSILDESSLYLRTLHFFFEANQRGLVDPDSTNQTYDLLAEKYRDGKILFSFWPWLGMSMYNTAQRTAEGSGFLFAPVKDMKILAHGCYPEGSMSGVIAIGSGAKDPERLAAFIKWLYSPEGVEINEQANGAAGPLGLTWDMDDDGKPYLTDFGKQALPNGDTEVPEEWGGGTWSDGISCLNFQAVNVGDIDPRTGFSYNYLEWESTAANAENPLLKSWREKMQADSTMEYLLAHDMVVVAPGTSYQTPAEAADVSAQRTQCSQRITGDSWKMVFAANEAEYESTKSRMIDAVYGMGFADLIAIDMQNAADQAAARKSAVQKGGAESGKSGAEVISAVS